MDLKIFKKKKSFIKENYSTDPNIYWRFILCFIFICIFGVFFFGWYFFTKTNKEINVSIPNTNMPVEIISKDKIKEVLEYFSMKEKKSVEIINSFSSMIDPSL